MRLELCVALAPTDYGCFAPMSVGAFSQSRDMITDEVRLAAIRWVQIAIGTD